MIKINIKIKIKALKRLILISKNVEKILLIKIVKKCSFLLKNNKKTHLSIELIRIKNTLSKLLKINIIFKEKSP